MKILKFLLLIPVKLFIFALSIAAESNDSDSSDMYKSKISYKPVGEDGEMIQVTEKIDD